MPLSRQPNEHPARNQISQDAFNQAVQLEKIRVADALLDDLALLVDDKGGGVDANVAEDLGRGFENCFPNGGRRVAATYPQLDSRPGR